MSFSRFRLRSLMILILVAALVMAAVLHRPRMDEIDFEALRDRVFLIAPFLIFVVLKMSLVVSSRRKRASFEDDTLPGPVKESRTDPPSSS